MAESWLAAGEETVGSWSVFLGDPTPNSAKITGKLFVTNQFVHFEAGVSLEEGAAALIGRRIKAFQKLDRHVAIPFAEIAEAKSVKKSLFVKALAVKLKSGEELEFQFGAASPQKAADAIASKI
ncbi:MAG: hypothetical protein FJY82_12885 [Candidatus Aminicenantes bacterium]|nr:hypothetical protein [Candidatus Aminicenantes bacterium]